MHPLKEGNNGKCKERDHIVAHAWPAAAVSVVSARQAAASPYPLSMRVLGADQPSLADQRNTHHLHPPIFRVLLAASARRDLPPSLLLLVEVVEGGLQDWER
jgi:hypothetical protein